VSNPLSILAYRVASLPDRSKRLDQYCQALIYASAALALPETAEDRELRQRNTRAVALRRLGKLSAENRARVEQCGGVIEED